MKKLLIGIAVLSQITSPVQAEEGISSVREILRVLTNQVDWNFQRGLQ